MQELLAAGANPNARRGKKTAFQLVPHGADVDADNMISTPLMNAIKYGHFDIALELVAAGADPNRTLTFASVPPMAIAAVQGSAAVIRALLAAGAKADVSIRQIAINRVTLSRKRHDRH